MTGVGVTPSFSWMMVSTPFAASTSSAVRCAGAETAWVSFPIYSGPSIPCPRRYSQMACVMARMCASLNVPCSGEPRCPLVPKLTSWLRIAHVGPALVILPLQTSQVDQHFLRRGFAGQRGNRRARFRGLFFYGTGTWFHLPDLGCVFVQWCGRSRTFRSWRRSGWPCCAQSPGRHTARPACSCAWQ